MDEWGFQPSLCATRPGKPPEGGEMNEMTLPSRHRNRNSNSGGLRLSSLTPITDALHDNKSLRVSREKTSCSLKLERQRVFRTRDLRLSMQAALTTAHGPPPPGLLLW